MKTLQQWFDEYAISHQNHTNKMIHYICVPLISFSIVGLLMSIPMNFIPHYFNHQALFFNWASMALLFVLIFYLRLSKGVALRMFLFSLACIFLNYLLAQVLTLWIVSVIIFAAAWVGQFMVMK